MPNKKQYMRFAARQAHRFGIPVPLFFGMIQQESGWNQDSISSAGAIGLTQKMGWTEAEKQRLRNNWRYNVIAGAKELSHNLKSYKGDVRLALAAYNAGPGAVSKYGGVPPYAETQAYIPAVLKYRDQYKKQLAGSRLLMGGGTPVKKQNRKNPRTLLDASPLSLSDPATAAAIAQQVAGGMGGGGFVEAFPKTNALLQPVQSTVQPIGELTNRVAQTVAEPIPTATRYQAPPDLAPLIAALGSGGAVGQETQKNWKDGKPTKAPTPGNPNQAITALFHAAQLTSRKSSGYSKETARLLGKVKLTQPLDCSLSVAKVLQMAGLGFGPNDTAPVSGDMAKNWGKPGKGKFLTMWANDGHVFLEFKVGGKYYRFDTSAHGAKDSRSGPRLRNTKRSTEGFTPRHWPGL